MRRLLIAAVIAVACGFVPTAQADGGPSVAESAGLKGVVTPTGFRYVVINTRETSVLTRIAPSGRVVAMKWLPAGLGIPAVAYDATPAGLSADGKTLLLIKLRSFYPRKQTRFLILESPGMFVRQNVVLKGDFVVDAISPDGSLIYFIQYLSRRDPSRYAVRAFDVEGSRLLPDPVVDRREPDEVMRGTPLSRVYSPDGRWAYTLYDGGGRTPFIHALDTVAVEARCIDLDALAGRPDYRFLRLRHGGDGAITIAERGRSLLVFNPASFEVSKPGAAVPESRDVPWAVVAVVIAVFAAAALSLLALRRRRLATS